MSAMLWIYAIGGGLIGGIGLALMLCPFQLMRVFCAIFGHDWTTFKYPPVRECDRCGKTEKLEQQKGGAK